MGLGFVVLFWGVVGLIGGTIGSFVLAWTARCFVDARRTEGRRAILFTRLFPFACLAWAGGVFIVYAIVNELVFHRDPGIGDGFHCPLPDGYQLYMIDVTDQGTIYNPKTQPQSNLITDREDTVFEARALQIAGPYIFAGVGRQYPSNDGEDKCCMLYYVIDTRTGHRSRFSTYDSFRDTVIKLGTQPALDNLNDIYARYRLTWFDAVAGLTMFGVPLLAGLLLLRWIGQIRRYGGGTVVC